MLTSTITLIGTLLLKVALGRWTSSSESTKRDAHYGFTISVPSLFDHSAGQLDDGTILLNVTSQQAVFYVDDERGITDIDGLECFVTNESPLRCTNVKTSATGLTTSPSNTLLYAGSPQFYLCPRENSTTYGIYLESEETNDHCIITTIQINRLDVSHQPYSPSESSPNTNLGSAESSSSLKWQTHTLTEEITETVTVVERIPASCRLKAAAEPTLAGGLELRSFTIGTDHAKLVPRAPGDLNKSWKQVRDADPSHFVKQGEIKTYDVVDGTSQTFATAEYYGCTVFVVVTASKIYIGHLTAERGQTCPLTNAEQTSRYLIADIEAKTSINIGDCGAAYVVITGNVEDKDGTGVPLLKDYFTDDLGIPKGNLRYIRYRHSTPLSEFGDPSDASNPVQGRSSFQWQSYGGPLGGTWYIYLGNEESRLQVGFDDQGHVTGEVKWTTSPDTTTG